jgi:hypothetical protein
MLVDLFHHEAADHLTQPNADVEEICNDVDALVTHVRRSPTPQRRRSRCGC